MFGHEIIADASATFETYAEKCVVADRAAEEATRDVAFAAAALLNRLAPDASDRKALAIARSDVKTRVLRVKGDSTTKHIMSWAGWAAWCPRYAALFDPRSDAEQVVAGLRNANMGVAWSVIRDEHKDPKAGPRGEQPANAPPVGGDATLPRDAPAAPVEEWNASHAITADDLAAVRLMRQMLRGMDVAARMDVAAYIAELNVAAIAAEPVAAAA